VTKGTHPKPQRPPQPLARQLPSNPEPASRADEETPLIGVNPSPACLGPLGLLACILPGRGWKTTLRLGQIHPGPLERATKDCAITLLITATRCRALKGFAHLAARLSIRLWAAGTCRGRFRFHLAGARRRAL